MILVWVAVLNRSREGEIYIVVEVFKDSDQVAVASTRYLSRIVFYSIINPAILGLSVLSVLFHEIKEFLWLVSSPGYDMAPLIEYESQQCVAVTWTQLSFLLLMYTICDVASILQNVVLTTRLAG